MSNNQELSPIEMKKEATSNKDISNFKNFGIAVFKNTIYLILVGLIGSNFVYISTLKDNLNKLFPTDENSLPYSEKSGYSGGSNCLKNKSMFSVSNVFKYRGGNDSEDICNTSNNIVSNDEDDFKVGFPYNYITETPDTLFSIFKNIIGRSTRDSYIAGREMIKMFFKKTNKYGNRGQYALFILSPIILFFLILYQVPLIIGGFVTFIMFIRHYFDLLLNYGKVSFVLISLFLGAFILGIDAGWSILVGIAQMFSLYGTLLIYPLINDLTTVRKIFACKSNILIFLFVLLTIMDAFKHLSNVLAITMSICLVIMLFFLKGNS